MTKFEELIDIITRNKNKNKGKNESLKQEEDQQEDEIEVAGSEPTKRPIISFGDDQTDMDLIDQLYFKPKHKPLEGQFADRWDLLDLL